MKVCDQANIVKHDKNSPTLKSMAPITWLLIFFGLNCDLENNTFKSFLILIKNFVMAVFLGVLIFYSIFYKINYIYQTLNASIKITDAVQMVYDYCQYIVDLYYVFKFGRHISLEYFAQYESIDNLIHMNYYHIIKENLIKLLAFFTMIWLTSSSFDFAAWVLSYGWITPVIHSLAYIFLFIKILTVLDLIGHIMHIEIRLEIVGDMIQNFYLSSDTLPGVKTDCLSKKNWLYTGTRSKTKQAQNRALKSHSYYDDSAELKCLSRCYLLLTEQVAFINSMYGFRILLNSLSLLIDMVRFTNIAVRIAIGSQQTTYDSGYFPAISSLLRLLTCVAIVVSLVDHCERTYRQKVRIVNIIDHLLVNKNPCENLRVMVTDLRVLLIERPIAFNMANFFILNYSLLVSMSSVVVTYTIILLQSMN